MSQNHFSIFSQIRVLLILHFRPPILLALASVGPGLQLVLSSISSCYRHPTPPTPGATTALLLFLLFLKSALLSLLVLFLGSFKLWREFFSCDYSSFFQF